MLKIKLLKRFDGIAQQYAAEVLEGDPTWLAAASGDRIDSLAPGGTSGAHYTLRLEAPGIDDGPGGDAALERMSLFRWSASGEKKKLARITGWTATADEVRAAIDTAPAGPVEDRLDAILDALFDLTPQKVIGTEKRDTLTGGDQDDVIKANEGDDTVIATRGDDKLKLGAGDDLVSYENLGTSVNGLVWEAGEATLAGDVQVVKGAETIAGTQFDDVITGGGKKDVFLGLGGRDTIDGGAKADEIFGGTESDTLAGGGGADLLVGEEGPDLLEGGAGADRMYGEFLDASVEGGVDTVFGDTDVFYGGGGNDTMVGGADRDYFEGDAGDDLRYGDYMTASERGGRDAFNAGAGDDVMYGGEDVDLFDGGAGDDRMIGGAGVDRFLIKADEGGADVIEDYEAGELLRIFTDQAFSILEGDGSGAVIASGTATVLLEGIAADQIEMTYEQLRDEVRYYVDFGLI